MNRYLLPAAALAALVASSPGQRQEPTAIPFTLVEQGADCGVTTQSGRVMHSQKSLTDFLASMGQTAGSSYNNIDWKRDQIIAVFGGNQPTTGYRVDVKRVVMETRGRTTVEARIIRPQPGAIVNPSVTTPYAIVRSARTNGNVTFRFLTD